MDGIYGNYWCNWKYRRSWKNRADRKYWRLGNDWIYWIYWKHRRSW
jgi:hypothetical protein